MTEANHALITLTLGRKETRLALTALLLLGAPFELASEQLTLSTTYPSPAGIYKKIVTTGDTTVAKDGGALVVGKSGASGTKLSVYGNSTFNGAATVNGAATITGAAGANSLTVTNNASVGSLTLNGKVFPNPPAGKTLAWAPLVITGGTEVDSYVAGGPYNAPNHTDTCDGNANSSYSCPNGTSKSCVDVQLVSAATSGSSAWCERGDWHNKAGGTNDSCNGDREHTYNTCDKTCTDVDCTDWVGNTCWNRSWSDWYYHPGTAATPAKYKDVAVTCNTTTSVTVYTLQAQ